MPLWPLDGGQLFRLGLMRWTGVKKASRATHIVALLLLAAAAYPAIRDRQAYMMLLIALLGLQNWRALRGRSDEDPAPVGSGVAAELVDAASESLREGRFKDAALQAQQARAQDGVTQALLDKIWEILGLAACELGEHEEALSYLRRARPSERVRDATRRCLRELGREDELEDIRARWEDASRNNHMGRWLAFALSFIVVAIGMVFITSIFEFLF
jgi:tetratricopeptide (TPR) repeat protein